MILLSKKCGTQAAYLADKVAAKFEDATEAETIRTKLMDPSNWYIPLEK